MTRLLTVSLTLVLLAGCGAPPPGMDSTTSASFAARAKGPSPYEDLLLKPSYAEIVSAIRAQLDQRYALTSLYAETNPQSSKTQYSFSAMAPGNNFRDYYYLGGVYDPETRRIRITDRGTGRH